MPNHNASPHRGTMFLAESIKVKCLDASRQDVLSKGMPNRNASPHRGIKFLAGKYKSEMPRRIAARCS
jgi:hypothetical protein